MGIGVTEPIFKGDLSLMSARAIALRYMPSFVISQVKAMKASLALSFFQPHIARHNYAGFDLNIHITDRVGRQWYDHD
jgi:hypothetical protein